MKRVPRAVREQQMLDAAVEVFARHGYHAAGVEEIASIAGISKPMVYLYFGSKEELFVACIRREAGRLMEMISQAVAPEATAKQQLWSALQGFFAFVCAHRGAWSVLYRQARNQGGPFAGEALAMRDRTVALITQLLARSGNGNHRAETEAVTVAAVALVGACESMADWLVDNPRAEAEIAAERLMRFAWPGLLELMAA